MPSTDPLPLSPTAAVVFPPILIDTFNDTWSRLPLRLLSYVHILGEAAVPLLPPAGSVIGKYATAVTLAYGAGVSLLRSKHISDPIRDAELSRKAATQVGMDSALTLWLECITLPGIGLGVISRIATSRTLTPRATSIVSIAALPFIIAAASHGAEWMMTWSFRPAIAYLARPTERFEVSAVGEYVPPPPEDMLAELEREAATGKNGGSGKGHDALWALLPPDFDALDRERLKWALDGNPESAYPMPKSKITAEGEGGGDGGGARSAGSSLSNAKTAVPLK